MILWLLNNGLYYIVHFLKCLDLSLLKENIFERIIKTMACTMPT